MDSKKDISRLNWAISVYSDIVKFGLVSNRIDESSLCLQILEEFEEYEKCYDIFLVLNHQTEGLINKISQRGKK
jgi:hypothetical protein